MIFFLKLSTFKPFFLFPLKMPLRNKGEKNEEILPPSYFEAPGKETFSLTEHSLMSQTLSHGYSPN